MKNVVHSFSHVVIILFLFFVLGVPRLRNESQPPSGFDESFFKLLEELGKAAESSTEDEDLGLKKPTGKSSFGEQMDKSAPTKVEQGFIPEKQDPESLFITPGTQIITQGKSKKSAPTSKSIAAYKTVMDEYIRTIASLKNKISNSTQFAPEFKERISARYQDSIDQITIIHEHIESKEAYIKIFLAPPDSNKQLFDAMKNLRKKIVASLTKIRNLDSKVVTSPEEEEQEAEELVQQFAQQQIKE